MSNMIEVENVDISKVGIYEISRVSKADLADEFAEVYATCFSGPPYYENYDLDWIKEHVYKPHLESGRIAVALKDASVIGFTCAKLLNADEDACYYKYLAGQKDLPFGLDNSIFVTELAVLPEFRRKGLGTALAEHILCSKGSLHQYDFCVTRTAHKGSNSLHIFTTLGTTVLPGFHYVKSDPQEVSSSSEARVYLWKKV